MANPANDRWAQWLLHRRHGGNAAELQSVLAGLYPVRDLILKHAQLKGDETLLDVGCGDGLVAFGALDALPQGRVIFSDISQDLLDHARQLAQSMGAEARTEFIRQSADNLDAIADASVDVVTTRSVLIYLKDKARCFREFYRVLKPGGRLSIFEPVNGYGHPEPAHMFWGADVTPVQELAAKVKALYTAIHNQNENTMTDFNSDDLQRFAEDAGFNTVYVQLERIIRRGNLPLETPRPDRWERWLNAAGNPNIPTLNEALNRTLTPEERQRFEDYVRPRAVNFSVQYRTELVYLAGLK